MAGLIVGQSGEITLPDEVCSRYGITGGSSVRLIETPAGILLAPESDVLMSDNLAQELVEWQALSQGAWALFPYDE